MDDHIQIYGMTLRKIARDLVIKNPGDKLMTIKEYTQKFNVSRGTIQAVLKFLEDNGCVELNRRGHQGTFIQAIDIEKTWEYTGWSHLTGATELPLNSLAAGLATGVCSCMKQKEIPYNFMFMQGSKTRIRALLENKSDFLIASELTSKILIDEGYGIDIVKKIEGCLYAETYNLFFSKDGYEKIEDGMTIAYDPTSIDQEFLSKELIKGKKVKEIHANYLSTYANLANGEADVIVGRMDVARSNGYFNFYVRDIQLDDSRIKNADKLTTSTILIAKNNYGLKEFLVKNIDAELISRIQDKVIAKEMVPNYY